MPCGNMGMPFGKVGNWNPKLGIAGGTPTALLFGMLCSRSGCRKRELLV